MDKSYKPKDVYQMIEIPWRGKTLLCESIETQTKGGTYTRGCKIYGFMTEKKEDPVSPKFKFFYESLPTKLKGKCISLLRGNSKTRDLTKLVSFA